MMGIPGPLRMPVPPGAGPGGSIVFVPCRRLAVKKRGAYVLEWSLQNEAVTKKKCQPFDT